MKVHTLISHWLKICLEETMSFPTEITRTSDHIDLGNEFSRREIHCWQFHSYCPFYSGSFFLWKCQPLNFLYMGLVVFCSITQGNPSVWCFPCTRPFPRTWLKTVTVFLSFKFWILLVSLGSFSKNLIKYRQIIVAIVFS